MRATRRVGIYSLMSVIAFAFLLPVAWTVSTSFKTQAESLRFPPQWIPDEWHWENFRLVFEFQPFALQLLNSAWIALAVIGITLALSAAAGYAFARLRFPGSSVLFILVLSGIFIPPEATIIPLFRMAVDLGWYDTPLPLVIFTSFGTAGAQGTFVMRQAFLTLPKEIEDAARIDGAGWWRTFATVMLPMVRPSLAAVVVLSAWHSWNQFLEPLIFVRSAERMTVPVALAQYTDPYTGPMFNIQSAATTLSIVPVLLIFMFAQRQVIAGLTEGGVK